MDSKTKKILAISGCVAGVAMTYTGVVAAMSAKTVAISATGSAIGGTLGGWLGSGIGMATGGVGMPATGPLAIAGAAIGSWAGPALAAIGIGTAPVWAMPLAAGGVILIVVSVIAYALSTPAVAAFFVRASSQVH